MAGKQFQFSWISMTFGSFEFKIESMLEQKKWKTPANDGEKTERSIWESLGIFIKIQIAKLFVCR